MKVTNPIKAVVIENDQKAFDYLSSLIENEYPNINILGGATTIKDGIKIINKYKPNLVFLDIELDDGMCFKILENVESQEFVTVFTTGYNNYYETAMRHFAFSYLLKPIDPEQLRKVITRYGKIKNKYLEESKQAHFLEFMKQKNAKILLNTGHEYIAVRIDDILMCVANGNYTSFSLTDNTILIASNVLKYYSDLLSTKGFFRANRSCLVNISNIKSIYKKETFILTNGEKIAISTRNRANLNDLINALT